MNNEAFINETKKIVVGESNPRRAIRKLEGIGYRVADNKGTVFYLSHDCLGTRKFPIATRKGCDSRWGLTFVRDIRHAMWKIAA